jgi:hypothetical protein
MIHTKIFENSGINNMFNFVFIQLFKSKVCIINQIIDIKCFNAKYNFSTQFFIYMNIALSLSLSKIKYVEAKMYKDFRVFLLETETGKLFQKSKNLGV